MPDGLVLSLPDAMREELKRPLGPVVGEDDLEGRLGPDASMAVVGDMTTATLVRRGHVPKFAVVDYQTKRVPDATWEDATDLAGGRTLTVTNPPTTITSDLWNAIVDAWTCQGSVRIVVEGEEDLATLPAILHAPEGATVIYGIPDMGLCLVHVDDAARDVVGDALRRLPSRVGPAPPWEGDPHGD